jgi:hypothetical protein
LPVPLEGYEVEWEISDCDDGAFCLVTLPSDSNPFLGILPSDRNLSGLYSSREILRAFHRLRI